MRVAGGVGEAVWVGSGVIDGLGLGDADALGVGVAIGVAEGDGIGVLEGVGNGVTLIGQVVRATVTALAAFTIAEVATKPLHTG